MRHKTLLRNDLQKSPNSAVIRHCGATHGQLVQNLQAITRGQNTSSAVRLKRIMAKTKRLSSNYLYGIAFCPEIFRSPFGRRQTNLLGHLATRDARGGSAERSPPRALRYDQW
jgi:hypothetical protein